MSAATESVETSEKNSLIGEKTEIGEISENAENAENAENVEKVEDFDNVESGVNLGGRKCRFIRSGILLGFGIVSVLTLICVTFVCDWIRIEWEIQGGHLTLSFSPIKSTVELDCANSPTPEACNMIATFKTQKEILSHIGLFNRICSSLSSTADLFPTSDRFDNACKNYEVLKSELIVAEYFVLFGQLLLIATIAYLIYHRIYSHEKYAPSRSSKFGLWMGLISVVFEVIGIVCFGCMRSAANSGFLSFQEPPYFDLLKPAYFLPAYWVAIIFVVGVFCALVFDFFATRKDFNKWAKQMELSVANLEEQQSLLVSGSPTE